MAITRETLQQAAELRVALAYITDARTRQLVQAWARAWDTLAPALLAGIDDVLADTEAGRWPGRGAILRNTRLMQAVELSLMNLRRLADDAGVTITGDVTDAAKLAADAQPLLIASQLPRQGDTVLQLAARFGHLDQGALEAIVARTAQQVTALTYPMSQNAYETVLRELIRGVTVGDNPRTVARQMLARTEGTFNGGLDRALVISRTETIEAHRVAAAATQRTNEDVLTGWVWTAKLDKRTCPACFSQHGTLHPLDEPGPWDHQQGRCARTPQTKTWRELGFDIPEPPSLIPDAETVFRAMPRADQLAVMGPGRLAALDDGRAQWADLAKLRTTPGWRDSYAPRPVRDFAA